MACKVKGQWLKGADELLNKPDTMQLVFRLPPVEKLDVLVHCYELFRYMFMDNGLILFDLGVLSRTTNLFYFKLNDILSAVNSMSSSNSLKSRT